MPEDEEVAEPAFYDNANMYLIAKRCAKCGRLSRYDAESCVGCGSTELVSVWHEKEV